MNNKNYYEKYWKNENLSIHTSTPPQWDKKSLKLFLNYFSPYIKEPILDLGIGNAQIAMFLLDKKLIKQISGVDISNNAIKNVKNSNIKITVSDIEKKLPFQNNTFNTVILTDVIEHLYDTKNTLIEINRVLKPNGKVLVVTPDYNLLKRIIIALFFWNKIFYPTNAHIRFFTKQTLNSIFQTTGFKNIQYKKGLTWFSIIPQNSYSIYAKTKHITNIS